MIYFKDGKIAPEFAARLEAVRNLLTEDGRTLPIPGFRAVAQVEENAGALAKGPLQANVMAKIDEALANGRF